MRTQRAGEPTQVEWLGTSRITVEFAPSVAHAPIWIDGTTHVPIPSIDPASTFTFPAKWHPGAMCTKSSMRVSWSIDEAVFRMAPLPTRAQAPIVAFGITTVPSPIDAEGDTVAEAEMIVAIRQPFSASRWVTFSRSRLSPRATKK